MTKQKLGWYKANQRAQILVYKTQKKNHYKINIKHYEITESINVNPKQRVKVTYAQNMVPPLFLKYKPKTKGKRKYRKNCKVEFI